MMMTTASVTSEDERFKSLARTWALFSLVFFGCLMIDCLLFRTFNSRDDLLPDFEFMLPFSQSLNNISVLFRSLRFISFCIVVLIFTGNFREPAHYGLLSLIMIFCYFISVKDTYQHHYLVIIIVFLISLETSVITPHRRILMLTSIVYFYTGITKLDTPTFTNGSQLCNSTMFCAATDKLYGIIINNVLTSSSVLALSVDQSLELINQFCFVSSWLVIFVEFYLSISLALKPFSIVNSVVMFSLHSLILTFQLINLRLNIGLFSLYMIAISVLCLPPTNYYTAWIERYIIPTPTWLTPVTPTIDRSWCYKFIVLIIIGVFFVAQIYVPYARCYEGKTLAVLQDSVTTTYKFYHENPAYLDERFCWRMFSDLANRHCWSSYFLWSHLLPINDIYGGRIKLIAQYGFDDERDTMFLRGLLNQKMAKMKATILCWNSQLDLFNEFNQSPVENSTIIRYSATCRMSKFPRGHSSMVNLLKERWTYVSC